MDNLCPQCGAPIQNGATKCQYCGASVQAAAPASSQNTQNAQAQQPVIIVQNGTAQQVSYSDPRQFWPIKSKIAAGVLAILLGGLGIHKFYLGKVGSGILYLLFCWTGIPAIIGLIEGIILLCSNDENFELKYQVRSH